MKKRLYIFVFTILLLITGALASCAKAPPEATPTATSTLTPEPTVTPVPDRMGAYLDNIYMFQISPDYAAKQILDGTLDIYASGLRKEQLKELEGSSVNYDKSIRRQYELLLNPADTRAETGIINPFSITEIRTAINTLLDREYIVSEIFDGGAVAKYQPLVYNSGDYNENISAIQQVKENFSYDYTGAESIITQAMLDNGCELSEEGNWTYKGEVIVITVLIRNDDEIRTEIGEYIADQIESLGFQVSRSYVSYSESSSLWAATDPALGHWHIYTGRYTIDKAPLNQERVFADYYTDFGEYSKIPLYQVFDTSDDFKLSARTLIEGGYESMEQRKELMSALINECNDYSYRIWIADEFAYFPISNEVSLNGLDTEMINQDYATVFTLKKPDSWGGELAWGGELLLNSSINPVNGSTNVSEQQYMHFTQLPLLYEDSDTGDVRPLFVESAEITHLDSINIIDDSEWIDVNSTDEIDVPNDAIISWDEEEGSAIYADDDYMHDAVGLATAWLATYERERPRDRDKITRQKEAVDALQAIRDRGYLTSSVMYRVTYSDEIFDLKWHDGSSFSIADIIMAHITKTQLMDEKSSLYDEYYAQLHASDLDGFKGFRIVSEKPLIIDYYTDSFSHLASKTMKPLWVDYGSGQQSWAMAAAAQRSIKKGEASYSEGMSEYYGSVFLDYTKGDGNEMLLKNIEAYKNTAYIPYSELLSKYLTPSDASEQFQNILDFYKSYNHLSIGMGPYMITNVDALTPSLTLKAYEAFPIKADDLAELFK